MKSYAGIGSRETPAEILSIMTRLAKKLELSGFELRSGGAVGADSAFAAGCKNKAVFLPWPGFNGAEGIVPSAKLMGRAIRMAEQFHPAWGRLSQGAQKLQARNAFQILGADLQSPSDLVLCWTPDGAETSTTARSGGTGQAIRMAIEYGIPVINLQKQDAIQRLTDLVRSL